MAESDGTDGNIVPESVRGASVRLRRATEQDCELLWEWANEPAVRAHSFSSRPIPFAEHVAWFRAKLHDSRCLFYVATNGSSAPIGQIRYDLKERDAEISLSVAPGSRGRGYGAQMLSRSAQEIFDQTAVATLHAYVKWDNEASIRAFEQANFRNVGVETISGHVAIHFILTREGNR